MTTEFFFEKPLAGSWLPIDYTIANHEAAHALITALLGIEVFEARIDRPLAERDSLGRDALGWVRRAHVPHAGANLAITIAPLVFEQRAPDFPSLVADDGDELEAALFIHAADMTRDEYRTVVGEVENLLHSHKGALTAISSLLLEHGAIPGGEIKRILDEVGEDSEQPKEEQ
jgi:hypothetical protein